MSDSSFVPLPILAQAKYSDDKQFWKVNVGGGRVGKGGYYFEVCDVESELSTYSLSTWTMDSRLSM
jgi:hypothetical protein